jgi:hypothetical protein
MNKSRERWRIYLELGRVSNLPTVWTNVAAGALLASGAETPSALSLVVLSIAISSFYVGGMFLNDAFDREIDEKQRPERPIPSGRISALEVFAVGYLLLFAGALLVSIHALASARASGWSVVSSLALGGAIVLYDAWHKKNPVSPFLMGLCRVLVYVTAAFAAAGSCPAPVLAGTACLLAYLIGLTYVAKQENLAAVKNLWPLSFLLVPFVFGAPAIGSIVGAAIYVGFGAWVFGAVRLLRSQEPRRIPRAVTALIAGISLLDALLVARLGHPGLAVVVACGFPATLFFQRYVAGT